MRSLAKDEKSVNTLPNRVDPDGKWLYRAGGISAVALGLAYIVITALYVPIGAPPGGAEARLAYLARNISVWRAIFGLSVLTDFLFGEFRLSSGDKGLRGLARTPPALSNTAGNRLRQQGSLISPFPVSPSGGKPGRAGSPHAAKSRRLPPQEGFQSAPLKPPLCIPPVGRTRCTPQTCIASNNRGRS